jgi:hypothetical protein
MSPENHIFTVNTALVSSLDQAHNKFIQNCELNTGCFSQSMFLTVDVIDSRCFRAKS